MKGFHGKPPQSVPHSEREPMKQEHEELVKAFGRVREWYELEAVDSTQDNNMRLAARGMVIMLTADHHRIIEEAGREESKTAP